MNSLYTIGFEDGFADCVCNDMGMTAQEAFAYRQGFKAGSKAREAQ
tara:strand:+ start:496 stop:633 length:138 start_codon:yes stop_codon:yes gene_type:complete